MFASVMYGPSYEPEEPNSENIELFNNIGEAIAAMFERHRAHGRYPCNVDLLAGVSMGLAFPVFSVSTYFQLYDIGPANYDGNHLLQFTAEQQATIIDQVRNREWDYHLALNDDGYGHYVKVSMA